MKRYLRVTMPDGSQWDVPEGILMAEYVAAYGETRHVPSDELIDFSVNNMDWDDVREAVQVKPPRLADYQNGWVNGKKEMIEK